MVPNTWVHKVLIAGSLRLFPRPLTLVYTFVVWSSISFPWSCGVGGISVSLLSSFTLDPLILKVKSFSNPYVASLCKSTNEKLHQSHEEPGGTRRTQEEPGGTRMNQEEPGGTWIRMSQEEPGGARRSQEEPGGTRRRPPACSSWFLLWPVGHFGENASGSLLCKSTHEKLHESQESGGAQRSQD